MTRDRAAEGRAAGVARLVSRLESGRPAWGVDTVVGRSLAGWRLIASDGFAVVLGRGRGRRPDGPKPHPIWGLVEAGAAPVADPEPGALRMASRYLSAAARGQASAKRAAVVRWVADGGALRLTYEARDPDAQCLEAVAAIPAMVASPPFGAAAWGGLIDWRYLAPVFEAAGADGWAWRAGTVGAVPVVEVGAPDWRVIVCAMQEAT